jgi:hypothetical protein
VKSSEVEAKKKSWPRYLFLLILTTAVTWGLWVVLYPNGKRPERKRLDEGEDEEAEAEEDLEAYEQAA